MTIGDSFQPEGAASDTATQAREHDDALYAKRVTDIPHNLQLRQAVSRRDNQPDYIGYGARGLASSADGWILYKFTYASAADGAAMTLRQTAYDTWDNRTSATYA